MARGTLFEGTMKKYRGRWYDYQNRYMFRDDAVREGKAYAKKHKTKYLVTKDRRKTTFPYIL